MSIETTGCGCKNGEEIKWSFFESSSDIWRFLGPGRREGTALRNNFSLRQSLQEEYLSVIHSKSENRDTRIKDIHRYFERKYGGNPEVYSYCYFDIFKLKKRYDIKVTNEHYPHIGIHPVSGPMHFNLEIATYLSKIASEPIPMSSEQSQKRVEKR